MHMTARAPVLSATSNTVCIWIIWFLHSNLRRGQQRSFGPRPGTAILNGLGLLHKAGDAPRLGARDRPALGDLDQVALAELALLDVGVVFPRARDGLSHQRVAHAPLDAHHDRLLHLVARHTADQLALVLGRRGGGSSLFAHFGAFSFM